MWPWKEPHLYKSLNNDLHAFKWCWRKQKLSIDLRGFSKQLTFRIFRLSLSLHKSRAFLFWVNVGGCCMVLGWRVLVWSSVGWSGTEWPAGSLYLTPAHRLQSIRRWNIFVYAYFVEGYVLLLQVQLLIIFKLSRWSIWLVILFISLQRVTCSTCINTYTYVPFCLFVNLVI